MAVYSFFHLRRLARIRRERAHRGKTTRGVDLLSFKATVLLFFGAVEAIFGIWVVVLLAVMGATHGLDAVKGYLTLQVNFTEPMFVVVIMALASTRPVLHFADGFQVGPAAHSRVCGR